jgi:hypothetical protein
VILSRSSSRSRENAATMTHPYLLQVQKLEKDFEVLDLQHVPHANNAVTDELPTKASTWAPVPD